jgi:hypothetical protein
MRWFVGSVCRRSATDKKSSTTEDAEVNGVGPERISGVFLCVTSVKLDVLYG